MAKRSEIDLSGGGAAGPEPGDVGGRVERESERRVRLGAPAVAAGVLYLLGGITVYTTLKTLPTVGMVQGLAPALRGEANPALSPGAPQVRFVDAHAFGLIAGNVLQALGVALILLVLLFVLGAVRFRRPETSPTVRPLLFGGGAVIVLVSVLHPVAQAVDAHNFITGRNFTAEAVERALSKGAVVQATGYIGLLGGLALTAGMIAVSLGASRTGLFPRWMMYLGIFTAVIAFTPFGLALGQAQSMVPAFWMVAVGILLMGRWPGGDPPAWAAGVARPWPSQAQVRAERGGARGGRAAGPPGVADAAVPEPVQPASRNGAKRRRKRGSRR
jgi:hypothetical protein